MSAEIQENLAQDLNNWSGSEEKKIALSNLPNLDSIRILVDKDRMQILHSYISLIPGNLMMHQLKEFLYQSCVDVSVQLLTHADQLPFPKD